MTQQYLSVDISSLKFDAAGLIPAVVQDATTKQVLMLAYMNHQALTQTIASAIATFWSRSRNEIWVKGATSGNFLTVESIRFDCDQDALLLTVTPKGPACHTGSNSCFEVDNVKH